LLTTGLIFVIDHFFKESKQGCPNLRKFSFT